MVSSRWITIVGLSLFCAIILTPPIMHGYIYPTIGDDTAAHMNILDQIGFFASEEINPLESIRYGAIYIVGYPLDIVSHVFDVDNDTLFLWFNYLALIGVGISLFFIFRRLIGLPAALLSLLIPIFTSYAILSLFYSGVIFEIINVGIILPFACYCAIKWWTTKKRRFGVGAVCILSLFAVFHSTGVYLPFFAIAGFLFFILYKIINKQTIPKKPVFIMAGVICGGIPLFIFFNPILSYLFEGMGSQSSIVGIPLLAESLLKYMSYFTLLILLVSIFMLMDKYKAFTSTEKLTVAVFSLFAIVMLPAMLFGWSPQPFRQGYDFAIFLSLVTVALVGVLIRIYRGRLVTYVLVGLAIGGAVINVFNWFGYNSALEEVDVEAIYYINTLPGDNYSCSDNVDHWIYSRYVEKDYLSSGGEVLVVRNTPMKSKVALVEEGDLTSERLFLSSFVDGDVEVEVYR